MPKSTYEEWVADRIWSLKTQGTGKSTVAPGELEWAKRAQEAGKLVLIITEKDGYYVKLPEK